MDQRDRVHAHGTKKLNHNQRLFRKSSKAPTICGVSWILTDQPSDHEGKSLEEKQNNSNNHQLFGAHVLDDRSGHFCALFSKRREEKKSEVKAEDREVTASRWSEIRTGAERSQLNRPGLPDPTATPDSKSAFFLSFFFIPKKESLPRMRRVLARIIPMTSCTSHYANMGK